MGQLNPFRYFRLLFNAAEIRPLPYGYTTVGVLRSVTSAFSLLYVVKLGVLSSLGTWAMEAYGMMEDQVGLMVTLYGLCQLLSQALIFVPLKCLDQRRIFT